jgi:hypothetical protein
VVITLLYVFSVVFLVAGVGLVLRNYWRDRIALGVAMSGSEFPSVPPLPLIAIGLFPFAFPEEDQRKLASFLGRLREVMTQVETSDADIVRLVSIMPEKERRELQIFISRFVRVLNGEEAYEEADTPSEFFNTETFDILDQATNEVNMSAEFAALVDILKLIETRPEADMSSKPVRQYRAVADEYQAWAGLAALRTVTRDLYRRRGSERIGGYIALIGAALDIAATMLWLWVL